MQTVQLPTLPDMVANPRCMLCLLHLQLHSLRQENMQLPVREAKAVGGPEETQKTLNRPMTIIEEIARDPFEDEAE